MVKPELAAEIAKELHKFHQVDIPGSKEPQLWNDIFKFYEKGRYHWTCTCLLKFLLFFWDCSLLQHLFFSLMIVRSKRRTPQFHLKRSMVNLLSWRSNPFNHFMEVNIRWNFLRYKDENLLIMKAGIDRASELTGSLCSQWLALWEYHGKWWRR